MWEQDTTEEGPEWKTWVVPDQKKKKKPQQKGGNVVASNNQFLWAGIE